MSNNLHISEVQHMYSTLAIVWPESQKYCIRLFPLMWGEYAAHETKMQHKGPESWYTVYSEFGRNQSAACSIVKVKKIAVSLLEALKKLQLFHDKHI